MLSSSRATERIVLTAVRINNRTKMTRTKRTRTIRRAKPKSDDDDDDGDDGDDDDDDVYSNTNTNTVNIKRIIQLNDGNLMPSLGLGTWQSNPPELCSQAVESALRNGSKHIDCASAYANEHVIGSVLSKIFNNNEVNDNKIDIDLNREDVFITSKLWNDRRKPKDVRAALEQTLRDLRVDYVDLYLIHWPVSWKRGTVLVNDFDKQASIEECWRTLEELKREGKVKSIGVSNFNEQELEKLMKKCTIKPAVNQIESHPMLPNDDLIKFTKKLGVAVTAYSPFARGSELFKNEVVKKIAKKKNTTEARVILRWHLQRGVIVIPKSASKIRAAENADFQALELFSLDKDDMRAIQTLDCDYSTAPAPWSTFPQVSRRNSFLRPFVQFVSYPFFKVFEMDIQKMGRDGFLKFKLFQKNSSS